MIWPKKQPTPQHIRIGDRGILTLPDDLTPDEVLTVARRFREALRSNKLIVTEPGMSYTPLPPRKRIRLAQTERWLP